MTVKVRVAPSPTGNLHIGRAQSALFNWLFARRYGGEFFLRIEDTDQERSKKEFEENIISGLSWLGIIWDNKKVPRSTDNASEYRKALEELLESGKAFWCHHTMEELEEERQTQQTNKEIPRHVCAHKTTEQGKVVGGIIRLAVDADSTRVITFDDLVRGPIEFQARLLGDVSIARNLDSALYHMAVTCDDIAMGITHVIRGEDHISNTPKQILIYEALGEEVPQFGHLPLLLGTDRSKLSGRHGATAVSDYQKDYLPEALVNYIGSLNYSYSKEILSKEEMVEEFDIAKIHKSGAIFDIQKLNWVNAQYIRKLEPKKFKTLIGRPDLPDAAVPLMTERLERLSDAEQFAYLWREPEYETGLLCWKDTSRADTHAALTAVAALPELTQAALDALAVERFNGQKGSVYWPLRVALSGQRNSAGPLDISAVIGLGATKRRIEAAIRKLTE